MMDLKQDWEEKTENNGKSTAFWNGVILGLTFALILVCGVCLFFYFSPYNHRGGLQQGVAPDADSKELLTDKGDSEGDREENSAENKTDVMDSVRMADYMVLNKIKLVEELIKQNYYRDEDISAEEMEVGIYKGMIASLGDAYSDYFTPEELDDLMLDGEGIYIGIGAGVMIDPISGYPELSKIYSGTPAEEAGLRENDILYKVAGEEVYGLSLTEVVSRIKGEEGTWVNLMIIRDGENDYLSIDVQRRKLNVPTVEWRMLDESIAYIQIEEFDTITIEQFSEALAEARNNGMKGLILDLRSNLGGSLTAVVEIAREILPEGMIVYTENKYGIRQEYTCDGSKQLEVPLVVLINGNSASASEILAGAIKDHQIGTLVGTTSYGKGIVQSIIPLSDGSAVKLTISSYFTPLGNNIHGIGVEPDVECHFDGEAYYGSPERPDNQLDKAVEVLRELMK